MTEPFRIAQGGRIDRGKPLRFSFDGKPYTGRQGDTLASALLANGVHLVGRSFKYHRPRGILAAGADEPNALVSVGAGARIIPNQRATQTELYEGLVAASQNRWPSLGFDLGAAAGLFAPLLPAGFYYKTFMWPRRAWAAVYEPRIRAAAGLGRAPTEPDPDRYLQRYADCDVLVVGAGPAGLAAALAAAEAGACVMLCDEQAEFGGSLLWDSTTRIGGRPAAAWVENSVATLARNPRVTLLRRTTAFGYFAQNMIGLCERVTDHVACPDPRLPRERLWQVRAREVILAPGAIERPLVFPGNDRPGIMLAGAARHYLNRYGVRPGDRAVVVTAHDAAYQAALDLHAAGVAIAAIADLRPAAGGHWPQAASAAGLRIVAGAIVTGTGGWKRVNSVKLRNETIACDLVLMSGGFTPSLHLFSQSRGKLRWDRDRQAFLPDRAVEQVRSAGAANGTSGIAAALADGACMGAAAVGSAVPSLPDVTEDHPLSGGWIGVASHGAGKAFVDFQNDVAGRDIALAAREGFRSIEHVKRYTTTGMATDQGKTSNLNALGIVAETLRKPIPEIGLTTFRMPVTPVTFGSFAGVARGELFDPVRRTPIHDWAVARGAVFEDVGLWKRAHYFPRAREDMHAAVARECLAVRNGVGIFDASTLGKIELVGPDAAEFLNRMYVNAWSRLGVGRLRYGIMLREDGFVMDDGVVARMAADRFHVTTTTGGAARVLAVMEDYLQTEWPGLDVWATSITEQWAVIAVQGPSARLVLQGLVEGIDLWPQAMPHMSVAEGRICGVPARLFRVSFTGELGFEVNVPADHGRAVWETIFAAGAPHGITPYGTETMHVLRAEKGYIVVGQETDGTVTVDDAGLGWAVGKGKTDFVGKRSMSRPLMARDDRRQLVGLRTENPAAVLEEGAQIVAEPDQPVPMRLLGHVTSSYFSATLGHSIALAMISGGRKRVGERLYVPMPNGAIAVRVTDPVFYDPEGKRLHG